MSWVFLGLVVLRIQVVFSILGWGDLHDSKKLCGEIALVTESCIKSYLREGFICI